jgi:hypothetical protein
VFGETVQEGTDKMKKMYVVRFKLDGLQYGQNSIFQKEQWAKSLTSSHIRVFIGKRKNHD